jgi:hypothetical protein
VVVGTVIDLDSTKTLALVFIVDTTTAIYNYWWFPIDVLELAGTDGLMFEDNTFDLTMIQQQLIHQEQLLARLYGVKILRSIRRLLGATHSNAVPAASLVPVTTAPPLIRCRQPESISGVPTVLLPPTVTLLNEEDELQAALQLSLMATPSAVRGSVTETPLVPVPVPWDFLTEVCW